MSTYNFEDDYEDDEKDYIVKITGAIPNEYDIEGGGDCLIEQRVEVYHGHDFVEAFDLYFYDAFKAIERDMDIIDIADTINQDVYDFAIIGQKQVDRLLEIDHTDFNCSFNFISIVYDSPLSDLKAFQLGINYMLSLYKEQYGLVLVFVPKGVTLPKEWGYTRVYDDIINNDNGNLYMKIA